MSALPNLDGRIALVTGASRGIGAAVAFALAEAGADVAVNYRKAEEQALAAAARIKSLERRSMVAQADVSDGTAVRRLVKAVNEALGPIDVLINNAGVAIKRDLDTLTEDDFDQTIAVNLKSAFLCTQAVLPGMRERRWGRIVNISSGAARGAGSVGLHYNASKAGMEGLTRGYAARLIDQGVTVNAVAPSLVATDMIANWGIDTDKNGNTGNGPRVGTVEEVAQAVLMVATNAYMTGQTVQLNGGRSFI